MFSTAAMPQRVIRNLTLTLQAEGSGRASNRPGRRARWRTCEAGGLSKFRHPCDSSAMYLRRLLKIAFAALVSVGLAMTPLATAAAAFPQSAGMVMTADMPCCPDRQKSKDCQDCPLLAMCVLKTTQAGPSTADALPLRHAIRTKHSVLDDVLADGLDRPPLDHPPRTLI
jgi:hypothetical protein